MKGIAIKGASQDHSVKQTFIRQVIAGIQRSLQGQKPLGLRPGLPQYVQDLPMPRGATFASPLALVRRNFPIALLTPVDSAPSNTL